MSCIDNTTSSPSDSTGFILITKHSTLDSRLSQILESIDLVIDSVSVSSHGNSHLLRIIRVEIGLKIPEGPHLKIGQHVFKSSELALFNKSRFTDTKKILTQ